MVLANVVVLLPAKSNPTGLKLEPICVTTKDPESPLALNAGDRREGLLIPI